VLPAHQRPYGAVSEQYPFWEEALKPVAPAIGAAVHLYKDRRPSDVAANRQTQ